MNKQTADLVKRLEERDDDSDFRDLCGLIDESAAHLRKQADEIERLDKANREMLAQGTTG